MSSDAEHYIAKSGHFFGVYILYSNNTKGKGDVYIGFTVNPERRIRQHNREIKGGALKTGKNKGSWDMVLITHGFRTRLSALQFEWAWQNPQKSKRLSHLPKKTAKENKFSYKLRILSEMLNTGPWARLPLTIQWLKQEYTQQFPISRPPPVHMPIAYGPITTFKESAAKKKDSQQTEQSEDSQEQDSQKDEKDEITSSHKYCPLCHGTEVANENELTFLNCIVKSCDFVAHVECFAKHFLDQENTKEEKSFLIPLAGSCPRCKQEMMWGDILKQKEYTVEDYCDENTDTYDENTTTMDNSDEF